MKTIAVCIVNYNTRDLLRACLHSALAENPDEIVVVDDASADGSAEMVELDFPSVKLIRLNENIGYGAASNRAVKHCRSEHILLLNGDTVVKPGALRCLSRYLEACDSAALIGPRILNPDGSPQTSCFHFPTPPHIFLYLSGLYRLIPRIPLLRKFSFQKASAGSAGAVPWVLGAALAFRRETFEVLGGFDESFFMYFEEVDLCYRASRQGWQVHFVPGAEIVHVGGASTEQERGGMTLQYFASLAEFYLKHYPRHYLVGLILMVKTFAFFRLMRDILLMQATRDSKQRSDLQTDRTVQRDLIIGRWSRRSHGGTAVPV
ncbi:MAG: glycosyltransferase family 2 protein [Chloroflexi bacterium]|nr:glycosyltransferase family 2 protein [Chloroflexota bacterium]